MAKKPLALRPALAALVDAQMASLRTDRIFSTTYKELVWIEGESGLIFPKATVSVGSWGRLPALAWPSKPDSRSS